MQKGIKRSRGFFDRTCLIVELALAKRLRIVSETSRVKISRERQLNQDLERLETKQNYAPLRHRSCVRDGMLAGR